MATKQHYEKQAAECLKLARDTRNPEQKALLLSMSQSWLELAEKAQKMEDLTRVMQEQSEENPRT
jgi:hypothetical protein